MVAIGKSGYNLAAVQADEVGARLYDAVEAALLEYGKRCAEVGGVSVIVMLMAMAEPTSASHLIAGALARYVRQEAGLE